MPVRKNTRVLQIDSNGQSSSARLVKSPSIRWWRSLSMATGAAVEASRPRAWTSNDMANSSPEPVKNAGVVKAI